MQEISLCRWPGNAGHGHAVAGLRYLSPRFDRDENSRISFPIASSTVYPKILWRPRSRKLSCSPAGTPARQQMAYPGEACGDTLRSPSMCPRSFSVLRSRGLCRQCQHFCVLQNGSSGSLRTGYNGHPLPGDPRERSYRIGHHPLPCRSLPAPAALIPGLT